MTIGKSIQMQQLQKHYYDVKRPSALASRKKLAGSTKQKEPVVGEWLSGQETYTLHKPVVRKFKHNIVKVNYIDEQWAADLCDMQAVAKHNKGFRYILTVVDIFSRYAW